MIVCCQQSAYKLDLQLSVDIVKKQSKTITQKYTFLFSPLQVSLVFESALVSIHSVFCSTPYNGIYYSFRG